MYFYKVRGMAKFQDDGDEEGRIETDIRKMIKFRTEEFANKYPDEPFFFVSNIDEPVAVVGIISEDSNEIKSSLYKFLKYIGLSLKNEEITEITINSIKALLITSGRNNFIEDYDDAIDKYNLGTLTGRRGTGLAFGDNIIQDRTKESIYKQSSDYLLDETLTEELDRIYTPCNNSKAYGHPVHYLVETDDVDTRRNVCQLLLSALYANKRLKSRRYNFMDFRPRENFSRIIYDTLFQVSDGGSCIIRYLANEDEESDEYALGESETIEKICETINDYRNKVLTIICLPRECSKAKSVFYENLSNISFVEIKEEFVYGEKARTFLKSIAKNAGVRTDKKLFEKLTDDSGYLSTDLHDIFDDWYNSKLRTSVFPQYKEISQAKCKVVKKQYRGSAYDDLQELIGLDEAKKVIDKVINYHKIQKIFADKGINKEPPSMHMVFTGNPGTAKTTVARLYAKIMKENGLLSKGQLVEVGRADLVGKYVGWTAPTVKSKFKAALGGMLFIDEAYSLVDGKNSLYGDEAINTIVQEMENHRDDVVVVFAGYPDKMEEFLNRNPGLKSRISFHVNFPDYTAHELCEISKLIGKKEGYSFSKSAVSKLETLFNEVKKQKNFGNGRCARNILEQSAMSMANRVLKSDLNSISKKDVTTIIDEDIEIPKIETQIEHKIGFIL